jgi:hypothetical protein
VEPSVLRPEDRAAFIERAVSAAVSSEDSHYACQLGLLIEKYWWRRVGRPDGGAVQALREDFGDDVAAVDLTDADIDLFYERARSVVEGGAAPTVELLNLVSRGGDPRADPLVSTVVSRLPGRDPSAVYPSILRPEDRTAFIERAVAGAFMGEGRSDTMQLRFLLEKFQRRQDGMPARSAVEELRRYGDDVAAAELSDADVDRFYAEVRAFVDNGAYPTGLLVTMLGVLDDPRSARLLLALLPRATREPNPGSDVSSQLVGHLGAFLHLDDVRQAIDAIKDEPSLAGEEACYLLGIERPPRRDASLMTPSILVPADRDAVIDRAVSGAARDEDLDYVTLLLLLLDKYWARRQGDSDGGAVFGLREEWGDEVAAAVLSDRDVDYLYERAAALVDAGAAPTMHLVLLLSRTEDPRGAPLLATMVPRATTPSDPPNGTAGHTSSSSWGSGATCRRFGRRSNPSATSSPSPARRRASTSRRGSTGRSRRYCAAAATAREMTRRWISEVPSKMQ